MTVTVDIAGLGFHGTTTDPDPGAAATVDITGLSFRTVSTGSAPRAHIASLSFYTTGGELPDPARAHIAGLHFYTRNPAPLPGESLLHMWDGHRLVQVTPMVWNGSSLEAT